MSSIPGLLHIPSEESRTSGPAITLTSFFLKPFSVPASHRYGKCRPVSEFDKLGVVGEGSYGTVFKVRDKITNKICALKRLKIENESGFMPQHFLREINNLKLLKHENIANLMEIAVGKNLGGTFLILEFCEYVLSNVIDDVCPALFKQPQIKNIMRQLLAGLDFIHTHLIFHRDLSPSNILFNDSGILKISDFGLSRKVSSGNMTPNAGLRWYQAPEILFGAENYTLSVDIWSTGCIFAEMMLKKSLFKGDSDCEVIRLIIDFLGSPTESTWPGFSELPVPKNYELEMKPYNRIRSTFGKESSATISLLQRLLKYNPSIRPSAGQCLKNAYFTERPLACSKTELVEMLKASKIV